MPPYTVLKVAQIGDKKKTEVLGEWDSEEEAAAFANDARLCDPECEYLVECPPPVRDPFAPTKPQ